MWPSCPGLAKRFSSDVVSHLLSSSTDTGSSHWNLLYSHSLCEAAAFTGGKMFCLRLDSVREVTFDLCLLLGGTASPALMSGAQPCSLTAFVTQTAHNHLFRICRIKHKPQVWKPEESLAREHIQWSKLNVFTDDTLLYLSWLSMHSHNHHMLASWWWSPSVRRLHGYQHWPAAVTKPFETHWGIKPTAANPFPILILRWSFAKLSRMFFTAICTVRVLVSILRADPVCH